MLQHQSVIFRSLQTQKITGYLYYFIYISNDPENNINLYYNIHMFTIIQMTVSWY